MNNFGSKKIADLGLGQLDRFSDDFLFKEIFEKFEDGIIIRDKELNLIYVNKAATAIMGVEDNKFFLNFKFSDGGETEFFDQYGKSLSLEELPLLRALTENNVNKGIIRAVNKKMGFDRWLDVSAYPLFGDRGELRHVVAVMHPLNFEQHETVIRNSFLLHDLFENAAIGIQWWDGEGKIEKVNKYMLKLLGYDEDKYLRRNIRQIYQDPAIAEEVIFCVKSGETVRDFETTFVAADGSTKSVLINSNGVWENGQFLHGRSFIKDVTEKRKAQKDFERSQKKYATLLSLLSTVVWDTDKTGAIMYPQQEWEDYTGQTWEQYKGWGWLNAIHPDDRENLRKDWLKALRDKDKNYSSSGRIWNAETQSYRHFETRGVPIMNSSGDVQEWIGTITDVHDKRQAEEQRLIAQEKIEYNYLHDPLTDLPNRVWFNETLAKEMASASDTSLFALFLIDLDRFKLINESLGHAIGDRLIQDVSLRLLTCLNRSEMLARLGGDEFGILAMGLDQEEEAAKTCQQILSALKEPFLLDNYELFITPSIGISIYPFDGRDASVLMRNAEAALYRAKEQGRNNFQFYTPTMNAKAFERLSLENTLRKALKNDEFIVYYQPQVDLQSGKIVQVEALIRWQHPELGLTFPGDFIDIAETTGLIEQIGDWVLRNSLSQVKAWREKGFDVRLAVNVSARQFQQRHLVRNIHRITNSIGFDPSCLELELTESLIMEKSQTVFNMLHELKRDGIKLAIDDFNTGYASLNYIKTLPIDTLKIDKVFVKGIPFKDKDTAIVNSIINLAHSLKMTVVGEGVERNEQLAFLHKQKCDLVQGFLLSAPVEPARLEELLVQGRVWLPENTF